jgi:hypothetical protein
VAAIDLAKLQDYSAFVGVRKTLEPDTWEARYDVLSALRFELGTSYTAIVQKVAGWMSSPPYRGAPLVIDATGVGVAVLEMFRAARMPCRIVPVTITGGHNAAEQPGGGWHVPKKDLVAAVQAPLSGRRLAIAEQLPEAAGLVKELKHFQGRITLAGNETFEAWRERDKDDLVLALALALWWAGRWCGPWLPSDDRRNRSALSQVPEGVFLDRADLTNDDDGPPRGRTLYRPEGPQW